MKRILGELYCTKEGLKVEIKYNNKKLQAGRLYIAEDISLGKMPHMPCRRQMSLLQ